jgi:outer membrane protein assembly factor BamB
MPLRRVVASLILLAGLAAAERVCAAPISHRVIAQDRGHIAIVNPEGKIEWEVPCAFTSHDIAVLPNGNFLLHTGPATIVEMTPEKQIVWQYESRPVTGYSRPVEIHAFQRLPDGLTMIAESGNRRIVEVDKEGRIVHQIPLTVDHPNSHRDTRLARKLANGHYLVCHEGDGVVREYDGTGKVVWSYALDLNGRPETPGHDGHGTNVFDAIRLRNGHTLIAGGNNNRVLEVTPKGKVVWSVDYNELPGIRLYWVTTLEMLPNGDLIIGNTHAGPDNPQLIEVTRAKKVVWTFKNMDGFGNDMAAAQVLDVNGPVIR